MHKSFSEMYGGKIVTTYDDDFQVVREEWEWDTPEVRRLREERNQCRIDLATTRKALESSPEAKDARSHAMNNPDAKGRYTRGGDRRSARAAETYARKQPAYKGDLNAYRRSVTAYERLMRAEAIRHFEDQGRRRYHANRGYYREPQPSWGRWESRDFKSLEAARSWIASSYGHPGRIYDIAQGKGVK